MRNTKVSALSAAVVIGISFMLSGCGSASQDEKTDSNSRTSTSSNKGNDIVAEYLRREASRFRKQRVRFTITSEDDPVKVYEIETWRKQTETETATLTQIVRPAEDADLASLTIERKGEPAKVTTFVALQNDFRETDTNRMFFGGLTAGELLGEWHKFDFKQLGEKEVNGSRVYELEGKIRNNETSVVERMSVLMRAAEPIPVELQLFDAGNRQIRTYNVVAVKTDAHGAYAAKTEVDNPIYKSKLTIEILSREFPNAIDDAVFTRERLKEIAAKRK